MDDNRTKPFPLRVVLTVTTDRLLTKSRGDRDNGIEDLYEILGWMTNDSPFTHQLPRFSQECKPWLLQWFPELGIVNEDLGELDELLVELGGEFAVEAWIAKLQLMHPELHGEYNILRIPMDDHERKNPYDELVADCGTDEGIVLINIPPTKNL